MIIVKFGNKYKDKLEVKSMTEAYDFFNKIEAPKKIQVELAGGGWYTIQEVKK